MGLASSAAVTVRITPRLEQAEGRRFIRIEGRLTGEAVCELEDLIGEEFALVLLELDDLRAADERSLAALRRLRAAGVEMRGASPNLAWQIEEEP
jgi:hypothetical protein